MGAIDSLKPIKRKAKANCKPWFHSEIISELQKKR